ncbi:MAG: response regulator [Gemmatimonadetes bacterium]|nr:response regulator [Gemmatimonadota bacterium]
MAVILIVDDNFDNRSIYCAMLEHRGHACLVAENGQEGVQVACDALPDIIVMDLSMPVMTGWQALELLKAIPQTSAIPVIALTAHALPEDEARARSAGFDDYVRKPAQPMTVVAIVERVVGSASVRG